MSLAELTQTHGWRTFMAKLYGIGAAVVIIGALFKIMHWPGAGAMLVAGLGTEAVIFFFSAFEPLHEELDWTLVYPQLAGLSDDDEIEVNKGKDKGGKGAISSSSGDALQKFDEMLEKAGGGNLFQRLGEGLNNLANGVKDMTNISNAALATNEFTNNLKTASQSVNTLSEAYKTSAKEVGTSASTLTTAYKQSAEALKFSVEGLADAYNKSSQQVGETNKNFVAVYNKLATNMDIDFSALKDGNKQYGQHLGNLNKNLTALNAIFEIQLKEADLDKMIQDLQGSVESAKKYSGEVRKLGKRLEALNGIYGNMLTAMNYKLDETK